MPTLPMRRSTVVAAPVVALRVYRITPTVDCSINIGPEPAGRVAHNASFAQLRAGVTYEFVTSAADVHLSGISRLARADQTPDNLDYLNNRAKPPPVGVPV